MLKERISIFNAYYLPGHALQFLYDSITPVNSFRIIFDHYFGTNLGVLEDKTYFTYCYAHIYEPVLVPDESYLPESPRENTSNPEWIGAFFIQCLNLRIDYTTGTNWVDKMI